MMNRSIEKLLLKHGCITESQLSRALEFQKLRPGRPLEIILTDFGYVSEADVLRCLGERDGLPVVDLKGYKLNPEAVRTVSLAFVEQYLVLPIDFKEGSLLVAARDPLMFDVFDELEAITGMGTDICLATSEDIISCARSVYGDHALNLAVKDVNLAVTAQGGDRDLNEAGRQVEGTPVVKMVNALIEQAYARGASDIHVEPSQDQLVIRIRVNGDLIVHTTMSMEAHRPITTRLKIMGGMDIAEKRIPQDGKHQYNRGGIRTDLRISALPTVYGEKLVLRLLNSSRDERFLDVRQLGMTQSQVEFFEKILKAPYGILLVTGPTGGGKSTTLYAAMHQLAQRSINVVSVEDPVEKLISGATQVQVNVKAGLTFATALRAILRQDPDVIMVGEMRDSETAAMGVRAAITGHLVLSTLHTNDCAASVTRLLDMGVAPYMAAAALTGVVSQRLVKELCPHCREKYRPESRERQLLAAVTDRPAGELYRPAGCPRCNGTGYSGRRAIYEMMEIDEEIRSMILAGAPPHDIRMHQRRKGESSLKDQVAEMVLKGETSMEEMEKIIYSVE